LPNSIEERSVVRLRGKTTLVIGGTRGIGRGIAEAFAREGAMSVVAGRDEDAGAAVVAAVTASGGRAEFVRCDALDLAQLEETIRGVVRRHDKLDVLVNNAGYALGLSLLESTVDAYDQLFDLNVRAAFFGTKWGAEAMAETGGGSIVNITSTAATRGYRNRTLYCGTKAAVLLMSKAAALDMAPYNVRINCISPGTIDTGLLREIHFEGQSEQDRLVAELGTANPLGRVGTVAEIGAAAVYFASDDAAFVTGANLLVDGGFSI
jgi:NAD(P)-dependent dehydrogenase (short-subunit alcohol dehydrogenase family)